MSSTTADPSSTTKFTGPPAPPMGASRPPSPSTPSPAAGRAGARMRACRMDRPDSMYSVMFSAPNHVGEVSMCMLVLRMVIISSMRLSAPSSTRLTQLSRFVTRARQICRKKYQNSKNDFSRICVKTVRTISVGNISKQQERFRWEIYQNSKNDFSKKCIKNSKNDFSRKYKNSKNDSTEYKNSKNDFSKKYIKTVRKISISVGNISKQQERFQ